MAATTKVPESLKTSSAPIPVHSPAPTITTEVAQGSLTGLQRRSSSPDLNPERVSLNEPPQEKILQTGEGIPLPTLFSLQERDTGFLITKEMIASNNQLLVDEFALQNKQFIPSVEKNFLLHMKDMDGSFCSYTSNQKLELLGLLLQGFKLLQEAVLSNYTQLSAQQIISITERRLSAIKSRIDALKNPQSAAYFVKDNTEMHRERFNQLKALIVQIHQSFTNFKDPAYTSEIKKEKLPMIKICIVESSKFIDGLPPYSPDQKIELWGLVLEVFNLLHTMMSAADLNFDPQEVLSIQTEISAIESKLEVLKKHPVPAVDPFPAELFPLETVSTDLHPQQVSPVQIQTLAVASQLRLLQRNPAPFPTPPLPGPRVLAPVRLRTRDVFCCAMAVFIAGLTLGIYYGFNPKM